MYVCPLQSSYLMCLLDNPLQVTLTLPQHKPGFLTDDELKHLVVEVRGVSSDGVTAVRGAW